MSAFHELPVGVGINDVVAMDYCGDEYERAFVRDLAALLRVFQDPSVVAGASFDLYKYCYSSRVAEGCQRSGMEIAEDLFSGADGVYTLPSVEAKMIRVNVDVLKDVIVPGCVYVSLGCGPHLSVCKKDIPTARAVGAAGFVAVDINGDMAQSAAFQVKQKMPEMGANIGYIRADFSQPFKLPDFAIGKPILLGMYGGTLGQFADDGTKDSPLSKLLKNLYNVCEGKGIFLATVDSQKHEIATDAYIGSTYQEFMSNMWRVAADIVGDRQFDPKAFLSTPRYDKSLDAVIHSYVTRWPTSLAIDGETYPIGVGKTLDIGCSQKRSPDDLVCALHHTGWSLLKHKFNYEGNAKYLVMKGKDTPGEWVPRNSVGKSDVHSHRSRYIEQAARFVGVSAFKRVQLAV